MPDSNSCERTKKGTKPESMLEADRILSRAAVEIAGDDFNLILLYLRGVDISCHFHWRAFEPEAFPTAEPSELEAERELIAREYELIDRTLGELLEASGPDINIIVMSDHGFDAMDGETTHILLNFDAVLERLGFLTMAGDGIDFARTQLYSFASPERSLIKKVRFALAGREENGRVTAAEQAEIRARLEEALETVTYRGGAPVFVVRDPSAKKREHGADFVVEVLTEDARKPSANRRCPPPWGHPDRSTGFPELTAARPPGSSSRPVLTSTRQSNRRTCGSIDMPPTILYAIGLPVADDFSGRARTELFTAAFRDAHALQTISTWGRRPEGEHRPSDVDKELVDQLRALGYID